MAKRLVHALLIIGGLLFSALGIGFIIRGKQSNANNETSHVKSKANIVGFNDVSTRGTGGNNGGSNESDDSNKRLRCRGKGGKGKGGKGKGAEGKGVYGKGGEGKGGKGSDSSSDIDMSYSMSYSMSYPTGPCYKGKGKGGKGGKGQSGKGQSGKGQSGKGGYYSYDDDDYDDDYGCECIEEEPSAPSPTENRDDLPPDTPVNLPSLSPAAPSQAPQPPNIAPTFPTDVSTPIPTRSPSDRDDSPPGTPEIPVDLPSPSPAIPSQAPQLVTPTPIPPTPASPTLPTDGATPIPSPLPSNSPLEAPETPAVLPSTTPAIPSSAPQPPNPTPTTLTQAPQPSIPTPPASPIQAPQPSNPTATSPTDVPFNSPQENPAVLPSTPPVAPTDAPQPPNPTPTSPNDAPFATPSGSPIQTPQSPTTAPVSPTERQTLKPSRSPTQAPKPPTPAPIPPTDGPTRITSQSPSTIDSRSDHLTAPPLPPCTICENGEAITNPDQLLPAPIFGVGTCGELAEQLQSVFIGQAECTVIQEELGETCGCAGSSIELTSTPTAKPSPQPTADPTIQPTSKPSPQPVSKPSSSPSSEPNPACSICDGPMDQVTNPDAIVTDPVTQDLVTCQYLVDHGQMGGFDEDQCSNIQNAQAIQDTCGCEPYECNICDSPMEEVTNPGASILDPITGDTMTCGDLADLGTIGGFDESQCSVLQSTQSVQDICGCYLPAPPELVGEWIGDSKVPGIKVGHCTGLDIDNAHSFYTTTIGESGFCRQIAHNVERPLDFGTMTDHQCVPCTSRYDVFNIRDGTGPSEKYNDYTQSMASCGTFSVKASDGAADEDPFCVSYRLSTMVPKTGPAEDEIRVMTLTAGNPGGVCPAHVVFDVHHMTLVDGVYQSYQMRYEGSGEPDLSDWRCPPSDV